MSKRISTLLILVFSIFPHVTFGSEPAFRFHLISEPSSLKPWEQKTSSAGYLLSQVVGTLLTYQEQKLNGGLAEKCEFKTPQKIHCKLRKNLKWSDGKPLSSQDFVRAFQIFVEPNSRAFRADLLFPLKNAKKIFSGELKKQQLGVKSLNELTLEMELEAADSEFLYTLTSPLLSPLPENPLPSIEEIRKNPTLWKSSGPYIIASWEAQKKITLKNNPEYWKKNLRPNLEIVPVTEDSVALNLYEKGELSFLRRLPTLFIPKYKGRPDFFEVEQIRFDYLGFSGRWQKKPELRKALAQALRYAELQKLYHSQGLPGCPGIPDFLHTEKVCLIFNLEKAKTEFKKVNPKPNKFEVLYSRQGGDDHKRSMEWLQSEWQKNLKFSVEVAGLENKIFIDRLAKNPPDLFRKGIAPDRPTCLSALETFETGNSENYIQFSNPQFDLVIQKMRSTAKEKEKKSLCDQALHLLLDEAWILPTGPIHFTLLASPNWKGWKLNELNHLDLSELKWSQNK